MLMLRLLCSHFADNALDFEDFNSRLNCGPLRIATALGCILEDAKELRGIEYPSVLLCIDELMKCGWHDDRDPTLLLSRVGVSMDLLGAARPMGRAVITVVTSLRKSGLIPMDDTDSSRPIYRVPLEGLSFDDCLRLVSRYVNQRGGPANLATFSWFQGMVALCSGHPRSLEYLAEELGNACSVGDGGELPTQHHVEVLTQACAVMGTTVQQKHAGPAGVDVLALLRCIIAGKPVALGSKVGSTTVEALIAGGLFTNAGKPLNSDDLFVVPATSMLLMTSFSEMPQHVMAAVQELMVSACHPGLSSDGTAFEALHTAVEVLRRAVLVTADGEASPPLGLDELFQHTMKPKKLPQWWHNTQVQFNVPRRWTTKGSEQWRFDFNNEVASREKIQQCLKGGDVIVPAAPGCDVVFVDQAAGKNSHIITFMEARYTRFKAEANRRAPPSSLQADLTTKFEVLTKHGVCVQACVCWCLRESNHSARSLGFERKTALERKVCEPVSAAPTIQR